MRLPNLKNKENDGKQIKLKSNIKKFVIILLDIIYMKKYQKEKKYLKKSWLRRFQGLL
jgi:hypothetical protein